ncbi:hypothetical protein TomMM35A_18250 [Sphingobium sp. TomMM35A]
MEMMPAFDDGNVKQQIATTLRMFVGGYNKPMSWADLALATGEKERTLRSYVESDPSMMPLPTFMKVFCALPPEAWGRINAFMGYTAPALAEQDNGATLRRAMAEASRLVADGNEYLEDGIVTPRERALLAQRAEALMPVLTAIVINKD